MNFVTYFNSAYLPNAFLLIRSIEQYISNPNIFIVSLDDTVTKTLEAAYFKSVQVIPIDDLMGPDLRNAQTNRNAREFIWTLTPFTIEFVLKNCRINNVTYIDADMVFLGPPTKILNNLNAAPDKLLLTPHYFDKDPQQNALKHGTFCVQFLSFNLELHYEVITLWKEKVLELCSEKAVDGLFGDQKYFEEFSLIFPNLTGSFGNDSSFGAPWNMNNLEACNSEIYHFHGFKFLGSDEFQFYNYHYKCKNKDVNKIYWEYAESYKHVLNELKSYGLESKAFTIKLNYIERLRHVINGTSIERVIS